MLAGSPARPDLDTLDLDTLDLDTLDLDTLAHLADLS